MKDVQKTKTSVTLDFDLKMFAKMRNINISKLVNDILKVKFRDDPLYRKSYEELQKSEEKLLDLHQKLQKVEENKQKVLLDAIKVIENQENEEKKRIAKHKAIIDSGIARP